MRNDPLHAAVQRVVSVRPDICSSAFEVFMFCLWRLASAPGVCSRCLHPNPYGRHVRERGASCRSGRTMSRRNFAVSQKRVNLYRVKMSAPMKRKFWSMWLLVLALLVSSCAVNRPARPHPPRPHHEVPPPGHPGHPGRPGHPGHPGKHKKPKKPKKPKKAKKNRRDREPLADGRLR